MMARRVTFLLIIIFTIISCSSSQKVIKEDRCPKIYKNNFTEIVHEKYVTVKDKDTTSYNSVRFECVYSSFYTHKVMYDKFGKWDEVIYPRNSKFPFLMWKKVNLFSDGKEYTVITNGIEEWKYIHASVIILDENGKDLLSNKSIEKEKLTKYFSALIKNHRTDKRKFYEVFWKTVDPKKWDRIKP